MQLFRFIVAFPIYNHKIAISEVHNAGRHPLAAFHYQRSKLARHNPTAVFAMSNALDHNETEKEMDKVNLVRTGVSVPSAGIATFWERPRTWSKI